MDIYMWWILTLAVMLTPGCCELRVLCLEGFGGFSWQQLLLPLSKDVDSKRTRDVPLSHVIVLPFWD